MYKNRFAEIPWRASSYDVNLFEAGLTQRRGRCHRGCSRSQRPPHPLIPHPLPSQRRRRGRAPVAYSPTSWFTPEPLPAPSSTGADENTKGLVKLPNATATLRNLWYSQATTHNLIEQCLELRRQTWLCRWLKGVMGRGGSGVLVRGPAALGGRPKEGQILK